MAIIDKIVTNWLSPDRS